MQELATFFTANDEAESPLWIFKKWILSDRLLLEERVTNDLFEICCERNPDSAGQRARLLEALKDGADVHATDKNGVTALHHAVRFRSLMAVKTLIEHGANVNQACRRSGSTPLHRAVIQTGAPGTAGKGEEATEIVRILLKAGASASLRNKKGKRPVDYVVDPAVKALLGAGGAKRKATNRARLD